MAVVGHHINTTNDFIRMPFTTTSLDFALFAEVSDDFTIEEAEPSKKVGFMEHVQSIPSVSPLDIIEHAEMSAIWYDFFELDDFRTEVRELCRSMRTHCTQGPDAKVCTFAQSYESRGLEQRSCLERQRRKYLTTKCIVRGQHGLEPERLAQLSLRCTKWSTELATEEAARDFMHAYYEDEPESIKRASEEIYENNRRVRARFAFPAEEA
jgi:hypothetical protein